MDIVLAIAGLMALVAAFLLAIVHLADRYYIFPTSGVWMGLADYARHGSIFPAIVDGTFVAGTRYMPLPVLLHAGLATITGEYLSSGKLLGLLSTGALCLVVLGVFRRAGVGRPLTIGLIGAIIAGNVGAIAALSIRPEAVSAALALAALAVADRGRGRQAIIVAAILCSLAFVAKLSAVYPVFAIGTLLLLRDRQRLIPFVAALVISMVAVLGLFAVVTDGRMLDNLTQLGGAGFDPVEGVTSPIRLLDWLGVHAPATFLLSPFVIVALARSVAARTVDVFQLGLVFATVILIGLMFDRGSDYNHLLDIVALISVVVGRAVALGTLTPRTLVADGGLTAVVAAALIVGILAGSGAGSAYDLGLALRAQMSGKAMYSPNPLVGIISPEDRILSDDASVPLSVGQRPVVLDPFMLAAVVRHRPEVAQGLAERIHKDEFDWIVLRVYAATADGTDACFQELGTTICDAILESYRLDRIVDDASFSRSIPVWDYYLYAPAAADKPASPGETESGLTPNAVGSWEAARSTSKSANVGPPNELPSTPATSMTATTRRTRAALSKSTIAVTQMAAPRTPPSISQFK